MKELNIFFFGFGQVAKEFIKKLLLEKYKLNLSITTRQASCDIEFLGQKVSNLEFNNEKIDKNIQKKLNSSDYILISIPPKDKIDLVLKYFSKELLNQNIKWITYLSATSVYGDHKGEWVDEKSETLPKCRCQKWLLINGKTAIDNKIPTNGKTHQTESWVPSKWNIPSLAANKPEEIPANTINNFRYNESRE